jgi:hypothetical protein
MKQENSMHSAAWYVLHMLFCTNVPPVVATAFLQAGNWHSA